MPNADDIGEATTRFSAYYQAALDRGADPLILLFFTIVLAALLVLGIKVWVDYRIKMLRLRAGYSPEPGEEKDTTPPKGTEIDPTALKVDITSQIISEMLAPLLSLFADNTTAVREMAATITDSNKNRIQSEELNNEMHRDFMTDAKEIKSSLSKGITDMTSLFNSGYQSVMQRVLSSSIKTGMVLLDKERTLQAWNDEGKRILGVASDDSVLDVIGKPIGVSHSKALGNNLDLAGIIDKAHATATYQSDVLELSIPGAEEGKWNWYLMAVLPFSSSTILLLLDIGDVSRGDLSESNNINKKKSDEMIIQDPPPVITQPVVTEEKVLNEQKTK